MLVTGQSLVTRRVVERVLDRSEGAREYVYRAGGGVGAILNWSSAGVRLWRDLARKRVQTLYLVCSRSNVGFLRDIPALLAARFGARVVVHAHGSDIVALLRQRPVAPLARWLYGRCTLVVPSNHLVRPLSSIYFQQLFVVENFVNARITDYSEFGLVNGLNLKTLWNSNIMSSKGAFDTLEAVAELQAEGEAVDLDVLGDVLGDEELSAKDAQKRLAALRHRAAITYHGRLSREQAARLLATADIVVLPSRYSSECQPLAIIEAMCAGKGLIVSDTPALRATVGDYPAVFIPVRSVGAIKDALRSLSAEKRSDPAAFEARYAASAIAARERFSVGRFDEAMSSILVAPATQ